MTRAPAFWWQPSPTLVARLLTPMGHVYGAVTARRMDRAGTRLDVPVVCVGNFIAGGAGKTPAVLALATLLEAAGERPAFLSRGYGRERAEAGAVIRVDPDRHDARTVGDEPLLLARQAPTYVARDRVPAGRQAIAAGATVLLLDDGLQNPLLAKTISVAVVDGATGIGNGLCLPAGPLRAPLAAQWPHVAAVCLVGEGDAGERVKADAHRRGVAVWTARLVLDADAVAALGPAPVFAFAGIGRPEKFFASLAAAGVRVAGTYGFPDHHPYSTGDIADLLARAEDRGARLVTTSKDLCRLPGTLAISAMPVTLQFDDPAGPAAALKGALRR